MKLYSFDKGGLPQFFARKGIETDMARAYSGQTEHVVSLLEHEVTPAKHSEMIAAATNREFAKSTPITAFRKGSIIPGWYD